IPGSGRSPGEGNANPLHELQIETQGRDRITSFRKSTVKKEKLLIQHPLDSQVAMSEFPAAQPLYDERSLNLSEKEVLDLFEKMM
ncbi:hypothetical protein FD755_024782, partial [Muntiacus reevesi]